MVMKISWFIVLCALLVLDGCAAIPVIPTESGKPEIIIHKTTKEKVANEIINDTSSKGFMLVSSAPNLIILDKPAEGVMAYFYGSHQNPIPNHRLQIQLTDVQGGVRILINLFIVTNPGTGLEKLENRNHSKDAYEIYQALQNLKMRLES
jgi:hypothetical protein